MPEMAHVRKIRRGGPTDFVSTHADHTVAGTSADRDTLPARARPPSRERRRAACGSARLTVVILKDSTRSRSQRSWRVIRSLVSGSSLLRVRGLDLALELLDHLEAEVAVGGALRELLEQSTLL